MKTVFALIVCIALVTACSGSPTPTPAPTPDVGAIQTQAAVAIFATQTAGVPTATSNNLATKAPSSASTSSATATQTESATASPPTETPLPTSTVRPTTQPPRPTRIPVTPTPPAEFSFQWKNPFYECRKRLVSRDGTEFFGARQFQITVAIKNNSVDKTLSAPWEPSRWIITNGQATRVDTAVWQWTGVDADGKPVFYQQPALAPGVVAEWTFIAFPVQADEWVDHLEWDLFGRTYESSPPFDPGEFRNNYHYMPCP